MFVGYKHDNKMARQHARQLYLFANNSMPSTNPCREDGLLLADSGFPCQPYLMTSYLKPGTNKQTEFNHAHTRTSRGSY